MKATDALKTASRRVEVRPLSVLRGTAGKRCASAHYQFPTLARLGCMTTVARGGFGAMLGTRP
jgi:hypothetical protein